MTEETPIIIDGARYKLFRVPLKDDAYVIEKTYAVLNDSGQIRTIQIKPGTHKKQILLMICKAFGMDRPKYDVCTSILQINEECTMCEYTPIYRGISYSEALEHAEHYYAALPTKQKEEEHTIIVYLEQGQDIRTLGTPPVRDNIIWMDGVDFLQRITMPRAKIGTHGNSLKVVVTNVATLLGLQSGDEIHITAERVRKRWGER